MKSIFLLLLIGFRLLSFAQKPLPEYGNIDLTDLQMTQCSFEPEAPAMKLFDEQQIEFEVNPNDTYRLTTERRVRIKIFKEQGFKYAAIALPYFNKKRSTKIKDLTGIVYTLEKDGKISMQQLEKKDFFKEKVKENVHAVNFTFPNLKPGSVIEFRYTKIERNISQIDPWLLQDDVPTAYAATTLITPSYSRVKEKIYGADTIAHTIEPLSGTNYTRQRSVYFKENIPSFKSEAYMSSYNDNLQRVIFMLIPESDSLNDALLILKKT